MAIVVVVCGEMCGKIGTQIGVVVDIDPMIMIVVTKRQKRQKDKKTKKTKKTNKTNKGASGPQSSRYIFFLMFICSSVTSKQ